MKVYMYFLLPSKELYAWTYDKISCHNFENQRCMGVFHKSVQEMDDNEASVFSYYHQRKQITHDILFDGEDDITIYCTISESDLLSTKVDKVYQILSDIQLKCCANRYPLKEKYCNLIFKITNIINDGPGQYCVDTYRIFYELFKYTLTGQKGDTNEIIYK